MLAVVFAWGYAALLFVLASEADSTTTMSLGIAGAVWMTISGAIAGYQRFAE
jgi:hypothetical protein